MEDKFVDNQNYSLDDNTLWPYFNGLEENAPVTSSLNSYYDSDLGGQKNGSSCKSHSNTLCIGKCSECSSFTAQAYSNTIKDQSQRCHGFTHLTTSHIVYAAAPPSNIPLNLTLSRRFMDSLKLHRRTRSTDYYGNSFHYAPVFDQPKLIVGSSDKWISINADEKARELSKDPMLVDLAGLSGEKMERSNLIKSPSSLGHIPLEKIRDVYNIGKGRSASKMSDLTFTSSSSSKSTCSYQSELSECELISKGLLRHKWNNGLPYFEFSLSDEHGEAYIANAWRTKSPNDKALDYIYTFYARESFRKGRCLNNNYCLVGKMKVSSCLSFSLDKSKLVETEFVLFDASDDRKDLICSNSGLSRSKGLPERMPNVLRQTEINSQSSLRYEDTSLEDFNLSNELGLDDSSPLVEIDYSGNFKNCFTPNLELSAIVVKEYEHTDKKETAAGGWGLRFLEKHNHITQNQLCESPPLSEPVIIGDKSAMGTIVLIPACSHGGPSTTVGGPSSLTERWRTGGHCDCGGWDIGCPLTVLHNQSTCTRASPGESPHEDQKPINFSIEGMKQSEPAALRIMTLNERLHVVSFLSKLSALQAFSVGVAIIHSQAPALRPEL